MQALKSSKSSNQKPWYHTKPINLFRNAAELYCFACLLNGMREKPSKLLGSMVPFRWEKPHYNSNANIWASSSVSSIFSGKNTGRRNSTPLVQTLKKNECISGFFGQGISNFFDKLQLDTNWNAKKNEESWMLQHTNTIINWKEVIF